MLPVWSLHTGKHLEGFNFKHPSPVQCVRISARTVYSSCDRGLVKIWDVENASLLRVRILAICGEQYIRSLSTYYFT